jgi:hypothetical protein
VPENLWWIASIQGIKHLLVEALLYTQDYLASTQTRHHLEKGYIQVTVRVGVYEDHKASARSDELEYAYFCDECAAERDVTYLETVPAGEECHCEDCWRRNREEEED